MQGASARYLLGTDHTGARLVEPHPPWSSHLLDRRSGGNGTQRDRRRADWWDFRVPWRQSGPGGTAVRRCLDGLPGAAAVADHLRAARPGSELGRDAQPGRASVHGAGAPAGAVAGAVPDDRGVRAQHVRRRGARPAQPPAARGPGKLRHLGEPQARPPAARRSRCFRIATGLARVPPTVVVGLQSVVETTRTIRAQSVTEIASIQNRYSLAHRQPERDGTLAATEARGPAFIPWSPWSATPGRRRATRSDARQ